MGTIFWNPITERWDISTKGSLHSEQADYARAELLPHYDLSGVDPNLTVITEILYPENRIVVDYEGATELRLLALRGNHSAAFMPPQRIPIVAKQLGMTHSAIVYDSKTWQGELADLPMSKNMEGYVVVFDNDFRVKIKNPWYLRIHKALDSRTLKRILDLVEGGEWRAFWDALPKELQKEFDDLYAQIRTAIWKVEHEAEDAFLKLKTISQVVGVATFLGLLPLLGALNESHAQAPDEEGGNHIKGHHR